MPEVPAPGGSPAPAFTVAAGNPTAEDIAAVVVVLGSVTGQADRGLADVTMPRSRWSAKRDLMRAPLTHGLDAWRASALPR